MTPTKHASDYLWPGNGRISACNHCTTAQCECDDSTLVLIAVGQTENSDGKETVATRKQNRGNQKAKP